MQQILPLAAVVVIAAGVFAQCIQVVAKFPRTDSARAARLGGYGRLVPTARADGNRAPGFGEKGAGFLDAGRFRIEIEITADFRRSEDRRGRAPDDVDAVGRSDRGRVISRIVESAHAAEIGLSRRAADVEAAGHTEKGLGKTARREHDQLIDILHVESFEQGR